MLVFEPLYTPGLAQLSYLVGDSKAAIAAVIDPRRDIDVYLDMARERGLRIAYVFETHIHADFASGAQALAARCGARLVGGRSDDYGFALHQAEDGETFALGQVSLQVLHSPGHTPEHISLLLRDNQQGEQPFALFTGDTLFNLDVGRPDLLGAGSERALAAQLHHTLFERYLPLGERMEVYPCHGAGSACGKSIGDRRHSTLGNELLFNPALKPRSEAEFVDWLLAEMPEPPRHYVRLKQLNARPAPLNIALRNEFVNWAGWMLDDQRPIYLVGEDSAEVQQATLQLYRIGLDRVEGYLRNGMTDWQNAGLPLERVREWTVEELDSRRGDPQVQVLDVRSPNEVRQGRVPGAQHAFVAHLPEQLDRLDRDKTVAAYCGSGYRASIAASILKRHGFRDVVNVPGSWTAWQKHDLPVQQAG